MATQSLVRDTFIIPCASTINGAVAPISKPNGSEAARSCDTQLDLLESVEGITAAASPVHELRRSALSYVESSGRGAVTRLATLVGVFPSQMGNFLVGRFGLNRAAAAVLRNHLATTPEAEASR